MNNFIILNTAVIIKIQKDEVNLRLNIFCNYDILFEHLYIGWNIINY